MVITTEVLNIALGAVYVSFGLLTLAEQRRHWSVRGRSHFAIAWTAIFLTCGPHHLDHGIHVLLDGTAGIADLLTVASGLPPGVAFLALRVRELRGGRGDVRVAGEGGAAAMATYLLLLGGLLATTLALAVTAGVRPTPALLPNAALLMVYLAIALVAGTTQLQNRRATGTWSLAGVSLAGVFVTCATMHAAWLLYLGTSTYEPHMHLLVLETIGTPAALYFLWVVDGLARGELRDWSPGATASHRLPGSEIDPRHAGLVDA